MKHSITLVVRCSFVLALGVAATIGCNAVLSNEEGKPRAALDAGSGTTPLDKAPSIGDGGDLDTCDTTKGNKVCFGLCVKTNETNTGCGGSSCVACDPKNVGATTCKGEAQSFGCAYDSCNAGYSDCDQNAANGCETSLGTAAACGGCGTSCAPAAPLCAKQPDASTYGCVNTCPPGTTDCSGACVDLQSSPDNCGTCGTSCARAASTATCSAGKCHYTCAAGTHECNGACVSDIDSNNCGSSCTVCPANPSIHLLATCSSGTCGTICDVGWKDCDGITSNGCEVNGACPAPVPIPLPTTRPPGCGCGGTTSGVQTEVVCTQLCTESY